MPPLKVSDTVPQGFVLLPGKLDRPSQKDMANHVFRLAEDAPFYTPTMPRTGQPFSVRMTNFGPLGWVSDQKGGYRYQELHPETGKPWPDLPDPVIALWQDVTGRGDAPHCCLVNWYHGPKSKMGLHQDRDEQDLSAPVVSLSLGDEARFRLGGPKRRGPTESFVLNSGDAMILGGEARLFFHGIDRIWAGTSDLVKAGGRLNLTLRRVTA